MIIIVVMMMCSVLVVDSRTTVLGYQTQVRRTLTGMGSETSAILMLTTMVYQTVQ
jgi:hypothetical protein